MATFFLCSSGDRSVPAGNRSAKDLGCDGKNPTTGRTCVLGHHQGYHRDDAGAEWLDEGDLARPDWLNR